jgi:hypothetical protein
LVRAIIALSLGFTEDSDFGASSEFGLPAIFGLFECTADPTDGFVSDDFDFFPVGEQFTIATCDPAEALRGWNDGDPAIDSFFDDTDAFSTFELHGSVVVGVRSAVNVSFRDTNDGLFEFLSCGLRLLSEQGVGESDCELEQVLRSDGSATQRLVHG